MVINFYTQEEENSQTAMILACINGHTTVAELLIQKGADVNYPDKVRFQWRCSLARSLICSQPPN